MSVYRCYSEKKPGFDVEAQGLCKQLREQLGVSALMGVRILNRYDADQIDRAVYDRAKGIVFSEPQVDVICDEDFPRPDRPHSILAVEALPGQFDQRADSCAQCIQLMAGVDRPLIAYAKVYILEGSLSQADLDKIRDYLINPVESREASLEKPETLKMSVNVPEDVKTVTGFTTLSFEEVSKMVRDLGMAMTPSDLQFCQAYFRDEEKRDPSLTELRAIDTYWSDHCRHTTFLTSIDQVTFDTDPLCAPIAQAYGDYLKCRDKV